MIITLMFSNLIKQISTSLPFWIVFELSNYVMSPSMYLLSSFLLLWMLRRFLTALSIIFSILCVEIGCLPCRLSFLSFHTQYMVVWNAYLVMKLLSKLSPFFFWSNSIILLHSLVYLSPRNFRIRVLQIDDE